jgi:hypothetical protein
MKKVLRGLVPSVIPNYQMVKSINDFLLKKLLDKDER